MIEAIEGVVVGGLDLGESDRLVRLLTAEEGRITVVARHARASKRRFAGLLEPGTLIRAHRSRGRGRSLTTLSDADRLAGPDVARTDLDRIALLGYGCEVCAALAPEDGAAGKLFQLLVVWLELLEGARPPTLAARLALEAKALTFAGLTPALAHCAACGDPIDDPAVFDPDSGGALHARCGGGAQVTAAAMIELEALRRTPLNDTLDHRVTLTSPWRLSDFVQHQLGRRLVSRGLLEDIGC